MNPLEALLQPITRVLNRNIRESTRARELCERLDGKVIAIRVRDTGLAGYFEIARDSLNLATSSDAEPDVVITGSLDLTGDAATAQAFQQLLTHARPDIEEELSMVIGDTAAHGLGQFARAVAQWARDTRSIMGDNIREYLQEESRDVPSRYEVEQFSRRVGQLRDDVDRLAVRVRRLRETTG
jgi:ubiquinone biosynthesis protein UbiJ